MKPPQVFIALATTVLIGLMSVSGTAAQEGQAELGSPCGENPHYPWCDTSLSPNERAKLLLAEMTQDEKFDFMSGNNAEGHTGRNDGIPRLDVPEVDQTDASAGVRQGKATALPAPISLAATWDPAVAEHYGALIGDEAKNKGNDIMLGPGVNILRVPQNGRNFEYYGEDPYLASQIAVGWVKGLQSTGVIGNIKHYVANNQEVNRHTVNAIVDERTLREIYLPAFEAAVKDAGVGTVMLAYNRVNGEHMTENCPLVEGILKGEWGFKGFALSDYFFAMRSTADAANCGTDLEMPFPQFYTPELLRAAVASGQVSREKIDEHVFRQLRTMFSFGIFDRAPFPENGPIDFAEHSRVARRISEQGIVLLKNERNALPLNLGDIDKIAVIGEPADDYVAGAGSSQVDPTIKVSALEGIRNRAGVGAEVVYDDGSDRQRAAQVAAESDVAIVVAATREGEGQDRPCLNLTTKCNPPPALDLDGPGPVYGDQDALIEQVAAVQPNTVVVLETGQPVLMPWIDKVPAVVEAWYPGQEGGNAVASVLFGDVNPSGKLPVTFPVSGDDPPTANNPERYPGVAENAKYSEGIFTGYRHYDENKIEPLFPFGHGLSYTEFAYKNLIIRRGNKPGTVMVNVTVTNTGDRAGSEVAQLYLGMPDPSAEVRQPPKWLRGFKKVWLEPGQSKLVSFELDRRAFSYWNAEMDRWTIEKGCYEIMVGSSSRDIRLRGTVSQGGATRGEAYGHES